MLVKYKYVYDLNDNKTLQINEHEENVVDVIKTIKCYDSIIIDDEPMEFCFMDFVPAPTEEFSDVVYVYLDYKNKL